MLTRFEVKGFKSLADVAIDLGAVNVFIGANGSGKSNILEAIGFLGAMAAGGSDYETFRFRGLRPGEPDSFRSQLPNNPLIGIALSARDDQTEYAITIEPIINDWEITDEVICFEGQEIVRRVRSDVAVKQDGQFVILRNGKPSPSTPISPFVRLYFAFNRDLYQLDRSSPDIPFVNYDFFDELRNYAIYTPTTPQLRGSQDDIHRDPVGLGGSGLAKALEEMNQVDSTKFGPYEIEDLLDLIEWADGIGTNSIDRSADAPIQLRLIDRFIAQPRHAISALEASEGALYVLFQIALTGHERSPKIFAVDNFDQALHPRLARELTEMICDQILADGTRQMFATTHNPLVLNGLNLLDDRIRLFAVDRDAAGATRVERVRVTAELMAKADQGFSLARLWTMGRLGGVPHNY